MVNKYLESKIRLNHDSIVNLKNSDIELEYYLIENTSQNEPFNKKKYGIEILKRDSNKCIESEIIKEFSKSKEDVTNILNKLSKNTVTPSSVLFILDDILGT